MGIVVVNVVVWDVCVGALQGLKVFDSSVETITTGTWQALGSAWKSGSLLVQKYSTLLNSISLPAVMP